MYGRSVRAPAGDIRLPFRYLPKQSDIKITWEKGLYQDLPESMIPGGYGVSLQNWEPNDAGGLRARVAWTLAYNSQGGSTWQAPDGTPHTNQFNTTRQTRGVFLAPLLGTNNKHFYIAGVQNPLGDDGTGNPPWGAAEIWVMDTGSAATQPYAPGIYGTQLPGQHRPPGTGGGGWFPIWTFRTDHMMAGGRSDFSIAPPVFARYNNHLFFTFPQALSLVRWDGTVPSLAANVDRMDSSSGPWTGDDTHGGRALAVFKSRLFVGGQDPAQGPAYRLFYSAITDETKWGANNYLDVGKEDEWAIEDMCMWQETLVIGKISGIHLLTGAGPSTFQQQTIKGMQACQGRSLVSTPYGICVLGDSDIWMWSGSTPESIRDGVRIDYGAGSNDWRQATYCDGKIVIQQHGAPGKLLIYDPVAKRWWTEDVNFAQGLGALGSWNQRLLTGPYSEGSPIPWIAARDWPLDPRQPDGFEDSNPPVYQARSSLLSPAEQERVSMRHFYLRIRQRGVGGPGLTVSLVIDGSVVHTATIAPASAEGPIWERVDLHGDGQTLAIQFDQSPQGGEAVYDIEEIVPVFDAQPLR